MNKQLLLLSHLGFLFFGILNSTKLIHASYNPETNVQPPISTTTTTSTKPVKDKNNTYELALKTHADTIKNAIKFGLIGNENPINPTISSLQIQSIADQEIKKISKVLEEGYWSQKISKKSTICFYNTNESWELFGNVFASPVTIDGTLYPSVEHFFQGTKYKDQPLFKAAVLEKKSGGGAAGVGRNKRMSPEMSSFYYDNNAAGANVIMWYGIAHRIEQDAQFAAALLATGDAILVENAGANDKNWGAGADGNGKNKLGIMLMEMRALLQDGNLTTHIPVDVLAKLP